MAADPTLVAAMRRFFSRAEVETAYQEAMRAQLARRTEVTITSASFDGGNSSGQIAGDPADVMEACEEILQSMDGIVPVGATTHLNFSGRRSPLQD